MSIDFRNKFDYNKKEPFTFTYTIFKRLKKTNNTIKHYNTYEGFIGKLNEDPEYKMYDS
jgi:hypothetical protein